MKSIKPNFKSGEVFIGGGKFYPIHLSNREISDIISDVLRLVVSFGRENVKAFFRKDKGGKGIDIRIDIFSTEEMPPELARERRYSFGINANWDVVDFFDHWLFYASDGKGQLEVLPACEELLQRHDIGLEEILQNRREIGRAPEQNPYLEGDAWVSLTPVVIKEA